MSLTVDVVATGCANLASISAAFERAGTTASVTDSPRRVADADYVVLPGVGAFGAAMERLRASELDVALAERVAAGRPTLAVCLGLQLLAAASEESPGVAGLGIVAGTARRFAGDLRVPQLGWNRVEPEPGCALVEPGYAYFANTYRLEDAPPGWSVARTSYGSDFASAFERGAVLACQFHPELSGAWGRALIERWLEKGRETC